MNFFIFILTLAAIWFLTYLVFSFAMANTDIHTWTDTTRQGCATLGFIELIILIVSAAKMNSDK